MLKKHRLNDEECMNYKRTKTNAHDYGANLDMLDATMEFVEADVDKRSCESVTSQPASKTGCHSERPDEVCSQTVDLECDGSLDELPCSSTYEHERRSKPSPGFGFTQQTVQYRTDRKTKAWPSRRSETSGLSDKRTHFCGDSNKYFNKSNRDSGVYDGADTSNLWSKSKSGEVGGDSCQSDTHYCDLEDDGLLVKNSRQEQLRDAPDSVPQDFRRDQRDDEKPFVKLLFACVAPAKVEHITSAIYIAHEYADTKEGDFLGADLRTCSTDEADSGDIYNSHLLVNVRSDSPASQLKFKVNDEIVLLNDTFVPELRHEHVLNLFRNVKVDGKTLFKIIIRRKDKSKTSFVWIEITAILAPDRSDKNALIVKQTFEELKSNSFDIVKALKLYGIPGTQKFLQITHRGVSADVLNDAHEDSKILKRVRYYEDEKSGRILYIAALCKGNGCDYISVDNICNITLGAEPMWFQMSKLGTNTGFKLNDKYFAFNIDLGKAVFQSAKFYFEEYPANDRKTLLQLVAKRDLPDGRPLRESGFVSTKSNSLLDFQAGLDSAVGSNYSSLSSSDFSLSQRSDFSSGSRDMVNLERFTSLETDVSNEDVALSQSSDSSCEGSLTRQSLERYSQSGTSFSDMSLPLDDEKKDQEHAVAIATGEKCMRLNEPNTPSSLIKHLSL